MKCTWFIMAIWVVKFLRVEYKKFQKMANNQHIQNKKKYFVNRHSADLSKSTKIWPSMSIFYGTNHLGFSKNVIEPYHFKSKFFDNIYSQNTIFSLKFVDLLPIHNFVSLPLQTWQSMYVSIWFIVSPRIRFLWRWKWKF